MKRTTVSGIGMPKRFASTLAAFHSGILAYYDFERLFTALLKEINNGSSKKSVGNF